MEYNRGCEISHSVSRLSHKILALCLWNAALRLLQTSLRYNWIQVYIHRGLRLIKDVLLRHSVLSPQLPPDEYHDSKWDSDDCKIPQPRIDHEGGFSIISYIDRKKNHTEEGLYGCQVRYFWAVKNKPTETKVPGRKNIVRTAMLVDI